MTERHATSRTLRALAGAAVLALALHGPPADGAEPRNGGWALFMDNDAFAAAHDHDYTGGVALTLAGGRARDWPISLDPVLDRLDRAAGLPDDGPAPWHALQVAVLAFTPGDLAPSEVIVGDRPYASIVYVANSRTTVAPGADTAYQTSFAVGALGLDVARAAQAALHGALASEEPNGWTHQIADGGEPTARYTLARLRLRLRGANVELKESTAVSAGYITEANAALTLRWGAIQSPWWSFVPERAEYMTEPAPVLGGRGAANSAREFYVWAGVKARARAYNALLQGQFRDSDLTYGSSDLRPLMGEAWAGVTRELDGGYRVSWVLRYQTSELRTEPGDRDLFWGGLSVSRSF